MRHIVLTSLATLIATVLLAGAAAAASPGASLNKGKIGPSAGAMRPGITQPSAPFRQGRWTGLHDRLRPRRWTSANAFRRVEPGERRLLLTMANERPDRRGVVMRVRVDDVAAGAVAIPAGPNRLFRVDLPEGARVVRLSFDPVFVPRELGRGDDWRTLGVRLHADGGNVP